MSYDDIASKLRELVKSRKLKVSQLADWLRSRGVEVPARPSLDKLLEAARRSRRVKLKDLVEFVASVERGEEEYEREIIIRERGRKKTEKASVRAKRVAKAEARETVPLVDLILELWKGHSPQEILEQVMNILDDEGIPYKKVNSLTELVTKLPAKAQKRLHERLLQLKEWREFQHRVKEWIAENLDFARDILKAGGVLAEEKIVTGLSGVAYRVDVYGEASERYLLRVLRLLLLVEAKKLSDPVRLDDLLIFMGKAQDIISAKEPDEAYLAFFSASGFTDRAIAYAKTWKVSGFPVHLYTAEGGSFKKIV